MDQDSIPDDLESELCGRQAIRDRINDPLLPYRCASSTDLVREPGAIATPIVALAQENLDTDFDGVPDALEGALCQVENQNTRTDGECMGDDYAGLYCDTDQGIGPDDGVRFCIIRSGGYLTSLLGAPGARVHDGWSINV